MHYQGSPHPVERHNTRRRDMGTNNYSLEISADSALRTSLFLKGEGMLGFDPTPFINVVSPRGIVRVMIS